MAVTQDKRLGIKDLAAHLSLSVGTVSHALNDQPGVNENTRRRVLRAAENLGYVPDAQARAFRTRRSKLIGLVVPSLDDPSFMEWIRDSHHTAWSAGYDLLFASAEWDDAHEAKVWQHLLGPHLADHVDRFHQRGIPIVEIRPYGEPLRHTAMMRIDVLAGVRQICRHLLDLGHRSVGLLGYRNENIASHQKRLEAIRGVLGAFGLDETALELIPAADDTLEAGYEALRRRLETAPPPTAIMGLNDFVAIGGMRALKEAGYAVPRDVSLAGFGGAQMARFCDPPLTTSSYASAALGRRAVETLLPLIERRADDAAWEHRYRPEFVAGGSSAAPADAPAPGRTPLSHAFSGREGGERWHEQTHAD